MGRFGLIAAAVVLVASCARLPMIAPIPGQVAETIVAGCQRPFAEGAWQFVHAISAEGGGGRFDRMIGVTVVDTESRTADAALMTVEGLLVFAARWDGETSVTRALPPFDSPHLAEGLMADIRLLFLPPATPPTATGGTTDGLATCRYEEADGATVDVIVDAGWGWEIHRYDSRNRPTRTVRANELSLSAEGNAMLAHKIELTAIGRNGYRLKLELISAEPAGRRKLTEGREPKEAN